MDEKKTALVTAGQLVANRLEFTGFQQQTVAEWEHDFSKIVLRKQTGIKLPEKYYTIMDEVSRQAFRLMEEELMLLKEYKKERINKNQAITE